MNRMRRVIALAVVDAIVLQLAMFLAQWIRFEWSIPSDFWRAFERMALPHTVGSLALFFFLRLYSSLWRYAGIKELGSVAIGALGSSGWLALLIYGLSSASFPRSVLVLNTLILGLLLAGVRFTLRNVRRALISRESRPHVQAKRILIVGAGDAGVLILSELQKSGCRVVGFVDDAPQKQHLRIQGVQVLGTCGQIRRIVQGFAVDEVVLAMPSAPASRIRDLVQSVGSLGVRVQTIPGLHELINGQVTVNQIRPVSIEDLLGRKPVTLDLPSVAGYLKGERVLVTGAGGSIGSELSRQICRFEPRELILLGRGENSIFEVSLELDRRFPDVPKRQVIGDIRDRHKIDRVFRDFRPAVVFHAGAHKHVPFMEEYPDEAIKTNIFGTQNVASAALKYGARRFVMISTDKAVNPTSVMGASKRVAEMIIQHLNGRGTTHFVSVRFGNVLGSRGSVVRVFQQQIAEGGPITVTDPAMKRYFMTIPEATQLVIQAGALGTGGEVFVLDMGEPVKIVDLARNLITLSGFEPGKDIDIVITGRRPGEKLFEEILTVSEGTEATRHSRIFVARNEVIPENELNSRLRVLEDVTYRGEQDRLVALLEGLVPAYESEATRQVAAAGGVS